MKKIASILLNIFLFALMIAGALLGAVGAACVLFALFELYVVDQLSKYMSQSEDDEVVTDEFDDGEPEHVFKFSRTTAARESAADTASE